ncbi:hypothetical protein [Streptomyces marokkonensis]
MTGASPPTTVAVTMSTAGTAAITATYHRQSTRQLARCAGATCDSGADPVPVCACVLTAMSFRGG